MKRFMTVSIGVSALALIWISSAAGTGDSLNLTLKGNVPGFCTIHEPIATLGNGARYRDTTRADYDFSQTGFPNFFANADGTGAASWGAVVLSVRANATCQYILTSDNGILTNEFGATRDYYAWVRRVAEAQIDGTHLSSSSANTLVRDFKFSPSTVPEENNISIEFKFGTTGVLRAGTYRDTLRLVINAR